MAWSAMGLVFCYWSDFHEDVKNKYKRILLVLIYGPIAWGCRILGETILLIESLKINSRIKDWFLK